MAKEIENYRINDKKEKVVYILQYCENEHQNNLAKQGRVKNTCPVLTCEGGYE